MSLKTKDASHPGDKAVVTLPGTVEKIIPAIAPAMGYSQPEKAQIAVEGAEPLYREIRVENALQNSEGETVHLKVGAEVEVTIEAKTEVTTDSKEKEKKEHERKSQPVSEKNPG